VVLVVLAVVVVDIPQVAGVLGLQDKDLLVVLAQVAQ
jgi:hypothetical protein